MRKYNIDDNHVLNFKADVEVLFELPDLESGEWLEDPSEVDPQLLCSKPYASRNGQIGPFGLLALASKDLTEQTAVFFQIYKTPNRYLCLMCSDHSRLLLTFSKLICYIASDFDSLKARN